MANFTDLKEYACAVVISASALLCCNVGFAQNGSTLQSDSSHSLFSWSGDHVQFELGTITTDRPDFTEASSTVGYGVVQLEAGYTLTKDGGAEDHSFGEPLFRVGMLANWFELRTASFPRSQVDRNGNADATYDEFYLGAKIGLTAQEGWLPEMALIPQATMTFDEYKIDEFLPGLNWVYSWDLTENTSLAGSTQFNRTLDGGGLEADQWAQSIAVGQSLTDELGLYVEWFGLFPEGTSSSSTEQFLNGGFTLLLTENVQFDIRGGVGLNDASADYFLGSGFSVRWP